MLLHISLEFTPLKGDDFAPIECCPLQYSSSLSPPIPMNSLVTGFPGDASWMLVSKGIFLRYKLGTNFSGGVSQQLSPFQSIPLDSVGLTIAQLFSSHIRSPCSSASAAFSTTLSFSNLSFLFRHISYFTMGGTFKRWSKLYPCNKY